MAGGTPRRNAIFSPVAKPAPATIYFLIPPPIFPFKLFSVFFYKPKHVTSIEPQHAPRFFRTPPRTIPSDAWDLSPVRHLIDH